MNDKKQIMSLLMSLCLVALAACGSDDPEVPVTGETADLPPEPVLDAQRWLAEQLNVAVEQVQIQDVEQAEWPDSCLGLGRLNESCAAVITPGWRVELAIDGRTYEVRTDETGSTIRMVDPEGAQSSESILENTRWRLVSIGPTDQQITPAEGSSVTLNLGAGQAAGSGGCNSYSTMYRVEGNSIGFDVITSTLQACTDPEIAQLEQRFFQAVMAARVYEIRGDQLHMWYDEGHGLMIFEPANGTSPDATETPAN